MTSPAPTPEELRIGTAVPLGAAVLAMLEESMFGPFRISTCGALADAMVELAERGFDVLILPDEAIDDAAGRQLLEDAAARTAVIIVASQAKPAAVLDWLRNGAQDVMLLADFAAASLPMRLRAAIERKRIERDARTAYSTDLETGLPHQQQLIEHMSQLLALREREPAPMAVLALRIEGLATTEARLGRAAANTLRRKLGVRLRAGVRASDVVASLSDDSFAVLLGSILTPADAARVGAKLLSSLLEPFRVAGEEVAVATAIGIGQYPQDGTQPDALLRRAIGLAAASQVQGRVGFANHVEAGHSTQDAANDD